MDKNVHIIITHNPQDFFQGIEPRELSVQYDANFVSSETINDLVAGGYSVIITSPSCRTKANVNSDYDILKRACSNSMESNK